MNIKVPSSPFSLCLIHLSRARAQIVERVLELVPLPLKHAAESRRRSARVEINDLYEITPFVVTQIQQHLGLALFDV